ncbi:MAG: hypothetical protein BEN18_04425 [Epulopiscium sp. Nuni2H_MBin001]|nr:MAG: hypothetical protein BEN18_04425 [Epulopiscium sp. Nuni2H_MBin001]
MILLNNINVNFNQQQVLANISLEFEEGRIYGLIGNNGQGKSTLLNIIAGGIPNHTGIVEIDGESPYKKPTILSKLCIVRGESIALYTESTVAHIFKAFALMYSNFDMEVAQTMANQFKIPSQKRMRTLSRGMQTMVMNIICIASRAEILIFDEPTTGLDATTRAEFYRILLQHFAEYNPTIIIATHQIDETENLFNNVIIIENSKIAIATTLEEFQAKALILYGAEKSLLNLSLIQQAKKIQSLGSKSTYIYYGDVSSEDIDIIESSDIECEAIGLQDFFVEMTK